MQVSKVPELSIQVLVENNAKGPGIMSEHGLSLLINTGGRFTLFDVGQGQVLPNNAKKLGIDLKDIDQVVLSHGHFDHTAGIMHLKRDKPYEKKINLYAHEDAFIERYFLDAFHYYSSTKYTKDRVEKMWMCGIPNSKEELEANGFDIKKTNEPTAIEPGLIVSGEVPRIQKIPYPRFFVDNNGKWEEDILRDDQFILANSEFGWVLILGCNHADMVNTIPYATKLTNGEKIKAVIGGMHLEDRDPEKLGVRSKIMRDAGIEYVIPLHCVGFYAKCFFAQEFKDKFFEGKTAIRYVFTSEGIKVVM